MQDDYFDHLLLYNKPAKMQQLKTTFLLLLMVLCVDWNHLGSSSLEMSPGATASGWFYWAEISKMAHSHGCH